MASHETSIKIDCPVRTVYNQWTQFESFPHFMNGVDTIEQIDDTHTLWVVSLGGAKREFDAVITEQSRDSRIAWKSADGPSHAGVVTFHHIDDGHTKVVLQLDDDPQGVVEKAGEALGVVRHEIKGDLDDSSRSSSPPQPRLGPGGERSDKTRPISPATPPTHPQATKPRTKEYQCQTSSTS